MKEKLKEKFTDPLYNLKTGKIIAIIYYAFFSYFGIKQQSSLQKMPMKGFIKKFTGSPNKIEQNKINDHIMMLLDFFCFGIMHMRSLKKKVDQKLATL